MENRPNTFDKWPEPRASQDCPQESTLAEWVRDSESEDARAHLSKCATCRESVEHARRSASEAEGDLRTFMLNVRSRAEREAEQHSSWPTVFINYVTASRAQTVSVAAAVLAVALIVTSGLWRQLGFLRFQTQGHTIVMDRDVNGELYRQAVIELRDSYAAISSGSISKANATAQVDELNQALGRVDKGRLQPEQKQHLEGLQAQYQALVFDRLEPNAGAATEGVKAQNLETDFFSTYATYLAKGGEQLTVSPEVSVRFSNSKMYVIGRSDMGETKKTAADHAVRDLQVHAPDLAVVYKTDSNTAGVTHVNASSHTD